MKSFTDFIQEARTIRSKEDAQKLRQERDNPDEWVVRNKGGGHHALNRKSSLKGQQKRRGQNLKALSKKELEDFGKRNLLPDYKKTAAAALKIERGRKKEQRTDAQKKSKDSGEQYDVDHIQGQSNRKKYTDRWHKIHPGDTSDNRRVISQKENLKKNSKDTEEKKITRAKSIRLSWQRAVDQQTQNNQSKKREHADIVRDNRA